MSLDLRMRDIVYTPDKIDGIDHVILKWERGKDYSWKGKHPEFYILFDKKPKDSASMSAQMPDEWIEESVRIKERLIKDLQLEINTRANSLEQERLVAVREMIEGHHVLKGTYRPESFYSNLKHLAMNDGGTYYPRTTHEKLLDERTLFDAIYKSHDRYPYNYFEIHCSESVRLRYVIGLLDQIRPALKILDLHTEIIIFSGDAEQVFIKQKLDWIPDGSISLIERITQL